MTSAGLPVKDLFGEPPQKPMRRGYAGRTGEVPAGETCGSCRHSFRMGGHARDYWKCGHPAGRVSSCAATDIRIRAPACQHWEGA